VQPDPEEIAAWLRLTQTEGVGAVTARNLLKHFGLPQNIFAAGASALIKVVPQALATTLLAAPSAEFEALLKRTLAWVEQEGRHIITLADPDYPRALLDTADPPAMLYAIGDLALLSRPAIALVGSRNASVQGMRDAQAYGATLAAAGWCVISGLAQGIDSAAHIGALEAAGGASTIAVIGTGADIVYPARNRALAHRIAEAGLILSEYPLGTPAIAANFPRRNRIISGLASGVMVVEAAIHSGSLITARLALDQGREVFAVPGSIHSPLSKGCHWLIRQGAKLVESAEDVLEELRPSQAGRMQRLPLPASARAKPQLDADLQTMLEVMGFDPVDFNTLIERAGTDAATLATQLLSLELAGAIEVLPGARYRRLS
jgi:DNA processing protein